MLLRTIFVLALVAVLAEAIVHAAAALAMQALHQRALQTARSAFITAEQNAQATIAQTLAGDPSASSFPLPSPMATCVYADSNGCEIDARTSFSSPAPAAFSPGAPCPQTNCAILLQANSAVDEGRVRVLIATTIDAANGAQLATRSGIATFRTFGVAPYATLAGSVDASADALMNGGSADDAGAAASLITVQYAPSGGGAGIAGNVWQSANEASPTSAPAWER